MPAETAEAAPVVSGATTTAEPTAKPEVTPESSEASMAKASQARLASILGEEGMSEAEIQEAVKPKDQPQSHAEETENTDARAGADSQKGPGDSKPDEDGGKPQSPKPKAQSEEVKPDEEQPLTEQEQKTWPKEALARIHKKTAQHQAEKSARETAERKATEATQVAQQLQQQLQSVTRARPAPTQADPLGDVLTPRDLQAAVQHYETLLEFAELNPDGATDVLVGKNADGTEVRRDFTPKDTAAIRAQAGRVLRQAVPAKKEWLGQQQQHEQYARATLPEMFEPETEEKKAYDQILGTVPELTRIPGYQQWIAWGMIGRQVVQQAMAAAKAKEAGTNGEGKNGNGKEVDPKVAPFLRTHPPMAPGVPGASALNGEAANSGKARVTQAETRLREGGDEAAEVDYIGALRESQRAKSGAALV